VGVGKTSLLTRYAEEFFSEQHLSTIGVDFKMKTVRIGNRRVKQQLWDTSGQERFKTVTRAYYKGAAGIVFVFDVTNEESFNFIAKIVEEIKVYCEPNCLKILVGNKTDLADRRVISSDVALSMAQSLDMEYFETSAKLSSEGITKAMIALSKNICVARVLEGELVKENSGNISLQVDNQKESLNIKQKTWC